MNIQTYTDSLLEEAPEAPKPTSSRGRKPTGEKAACLVERHFPENIPAKPGAKRHRTCRDCYACKVEEKDSKENRLPSGAQIVKLPFVF